MSPLPPYLDALPYLVALVDAEGRVTAVNAPLRAVLAAARGGDPIAAGPAGFDAVCVAALGASAEDAGAVRRGVARVLAGSLTEHLTDVRDSGSAIPRWHRLWIRPLDDAAGARALAMASDVTAERAARDALAQSEQRFRTAFDGAPLPLALFDREGIVLYANVALQDALGLTAAQVHGASLAWLVHDDDRRDALAGFDDVASDRAERSRAVEVRLRRADGDWLWGRIVASALRDDTGRPAFTIMAVEDLTEERRLREELAQSQKMEAIGRLAGGVAHDFNNLITAIVGHGEMVVEMLEPNSAGAEHVREMIHAAVRASDLTRQLLAFARKQPARPQVVDLNTILLEMLTLLRRLLREDIVLATDVDPEAWLVEADPVQVEQVLINLAVNARDAMPGGGTLSIATRNHVVDAVPGLRPNEPEPGQYVCLEVSDTGTGIADDAMAKIFEPFFTTKEPGKGVGLGLSLCYGIVTQAGGHIDVDSVVGSGTTFRVLLPRARRGTPAAAPEPASRPAAAGGTETVLVVEDDPAVQRVAAGVLRGNGYEVLTARSGAEAIELAASHPRPIDLLITDVVMPLMGGREVTERIAAIIPGIAVMFISGYHADDLLDAALERHRGRFLAKPFSPEDLARTAREALDARHR